MDTNRNKTSTKNKIGRGRELAYSNKNTLSTVLRVLAVTESYLKATNN